MSESVGRLVDERERDALLFFLSFFLSLLFSYLVVHVILVVFWRGRIRRRGRSRRRRGHAFAAAAKSARAESEERKGVKNEKPALRSPSRFAKWSEEQKDPLHFPLLFFERDRRTPPLPFLLLASSSSAALFFQKPCSAPSRSAGRRRPT